MAPGTPTATASTTAAKKTSAFLLLPAEIRNQIYEYAVANVNGDLTLRCGSKKRQTNSNIGMNTVCRQVRAEFRPLFYNDVIITIHIRDLAKFLETFFPKACLNISLLEVQVVVDLPRPYALAGWNLLPLLQAKHRNYTVRWMFTPVMREDPKAMLRYIAENSNNNNICKAFHHALYFQHFKLFEDIVSGFFLAIVLSNACSYPNSIEWNWRLAVRKTTGKLDEQDTEKMNEYCRRLHFWKPCRSFPMARPIRHRWFPMITDVVGVEIMVLDAEDWWVETYVWEAVLSVFPEYTVEGEGRLEAYGQIKKRKQVNPGGRSRVSILALQEGF